ncbi:hypothetical protein ACEPAG_8451 [Sanghuangporus baumii]
MSVYYQTSPPVSPPRTYYPGSWRGSVYGPEYARPYSDYTGAPYPYYAPNTGYYQLHIPTQVMIAADVGLAGAVIVVVMMARGTMLTDMKEMMDAVDVAGIVIRITITMDIEDGVRAAVSNCSDPCLTPSMFLTSYPRDLRHVMLFWTGLSSYSKRNMQFLFVCLQQLRLI